MIATIVDWSRLGKVALYSLVAGIGVAVIFGAGVSSAAGLLESLRQRRGAASIAWGTLAVVCVGCALGAVVYGIVIMANK
jgi:di/tricarboxylate transporter